MHASLDLFVMNFSSPAPDQVNSVSGFPLSSTSVELSWIPPFHPNGNVTGYHIEYVSVTENGMPDKGEVNITMPSVRNTVTGLEENTLYHFTVSAKNSAGRGEGSTVSVQTSIDSESLCMPSGALLSPVAECVLSTPAGPSSPPREVGVEVLGPTSMEATWQAPPLEHHNGAILSYIIRYFPSNEPDVVQDTPVTAVEGKTIECKTLSNLEPFTRYSFKVSAVNAAGAGPFSTAVEGTTKEGGEC